MVFDDKKGFSTEVKFAVAAAYEKFNSKWEIPVDKLSFVDIWASGLSEFTVNEINAVADYCVKELRRPQTLGEFSLLCTRLRDAKPLADPIVSKVERMAALILAHKEFEGESSSSVADACQIAATISALNAYANLRSAVIPEHIKQELSGRLNMFFEEALLWKLDAAEGKGYWRDVFVPSKVSKPS